MTELFLIAHKVSGEAAFDVAAKMECPICVNDIFDEHGCVECDQQGFWWIIPTSGHRAYPYWWIGLNDVPDLEALFESAAPFDPRKYVPEGISDHYRHGPARRWISKPFSKRVIWFRTRKLS